jgi:putative IMPACT (imprinted ancient) family translation regulator
MLEVFRRGGVENVLCVVTRYFGGILLGAGGLTRAYAGTAKLALDAAGLAEMRLWTTTEITCPYGFLERLKNEIETAGGITESVNYGAAVTLHAAFPQEETTMFYDRLRELSAGTVSAVVTGERHIAAPVG